MDKLGFLGFLEVLGRVLVDRGDEAVDVLVVHVLGTVGLWKVEVEKEENLETVRSVVFGLAATYLEEPVDGKDAHDGRGEEVREREGSKHSPVHQPLGVVLLVTGADCLQNSHTLMAQ